MRMSAGTVIVTGASRGIGRAAAIRLARDFAQVAIVARSAEC
jgi:3-oxoacyl-[acyl-carrier protein] reductase